MHEKTYYIYILSNLSGSVLYIGVTGDLIRRITWHKEKPSPNSFTARYNVTQLMYYEATSDVHVALAREKQLKKRSRAYKRDLVAGMNPTWKDLYPDIAVS